MNSEQIAQARVLARLLPVAEQREVVEALLDEIERLRNLLASSLESYDSGDSDEFIWGRIREEVEGRA